MSNRVRYFTGSYSGFVPGTPPAPARVPCFPFSYGATATAVTTPEYPFALTLEEASKWWWLPHTIEAELAAVSGTETLSQTVAMSRMIGGVDVVDETELQAPGVRVDDTVGGTQPGAFRYYGRIITAEVDAECELNLFSLLSDAIATTEHMLWTADGSLILPSLRLRGQLTAITGDFSASLLSYEPEEAHQTFDDGGSFFSAYHGGTLDIHTVSGNELDDMTCIVRPVTFFAHGGHVNTSTGEFIPGT